MFLMMRHENLLLAWLARPMGLKKCFYCFYQEICFSFFYQWGIPANTQRWFNVDICWNNVATSVNVTPRWFNVDLSTLIHRSNSTLKQRWFWVDSKTQFCSYILMLEKLKLYINVEKTTVFQRRNNVSLSTLNQCRNFKLKQRWFWVDSKTQFCSYVMKLEKSKSLYNVEMITVFQRRNSFSFLC